MVELLREHKEALKELTVAGVVSPVWLRDLHILEAYENLQNDSKMDKYETLAKRFKVSIETVRLAIRKLSS